MAKLSKALRTDLNEMAALLRSKGRGRDTILAHINPEEAALLKRRGGSGAINPNTGIMEFEDGSFDWFSPSTWFGGAETPTTTPLPETGPTTSVETATPAPIQDISAPQYAPEMMQEYFAPAGGVEPGSFGYGETNIPGYFTGGAPSTPAQIAADRAAVGATPGVEYGAITPTAPGLAPTPATKEKGVMDTLEEYAKKYPKATGALESLLGTGAKVGLGYLGAKPMQRTQTKAAQEAQQMGEQFAAMGKPIQAMGYQQLAQAEAGQLTPAQQRQIDATRAQQRQALSRAGITSGTAALQTEANLQRMANEFTQNNINTALNMIQFGDKYVAQGIKAGYDANLAANQSANIFYQNLFGLLGGTGNVLRG